MKGVVFLAYKTPAFGAMRAVDLTQRDEYVKIADIAGAGKPYNLSVNGFLG